VDAATDLELDTAAVAEAQALLERAGYTVRGQRRIAPDVLITLPGHPRGKGRPLFGGPLRVRVTALYAVPGSWSAKKQREALAGIIRPTGKPDWDNLAKVLDAFNQVVWADDAQVVDGRIVKAYSEKALFEVEIYVLNLRPPALI
jgi:hypothetical protein